MRLPGASGCDAAAERAYCVRLLRAPTSCAYFVRLLRAAHGFDQPVGELYALVERLDADPLVAAGRPILIGVNPYPAHVVARDAGVARLAIVAESGRHGRYERHGGPHGMGNRGDPPHDLRGRRRFRAHDG